MYELGLFVHELPLDVLPGHLSDIIFVPLLTLILIIMKKILLTLSMALFAILFLYAQTTPVGSPQNLNWKGPESTRGAYFPDIFLQGTFIEIGASDAGSFGTTSPAPPGFHPRMGSSHLGFVADWEMNGWNASSGPGIPFYSGDYFLPGDPWEGFLVEFTYNGNEHTARNCGANFWYGVIPTHFSETSSGNTKSTLWQGTFSAAGQSLGVEQKTYFDIGEARFFMEITLTNTGSETLYDVEYARSVDPDQEQNLTNDYTTKNWVSRPTGAVDGFAEVIAEGLVYGIPIALRLYHPDAVASVFANWPIWTPNLVLDSPNQPDKDNPVIEDWSIDVAVRFPSLAPGASETFLVSYVLNWSEIEDPTPPDPRIPVSDWALYLGILLIVTFSVIRFRRIS